MFSYRRFAYQYTNLARTTLASVHGLPSSSQSMTAPVRRAKASPVSPSACVAVAGAGGFGQFCLEAYRQTGDISVAAVADPNLAGSVPPTHPELTITADWRS